MSKTSSDEHRFDMADYAATAAELDPLENVESHYVAQRGECALCPARLGPTSGMILDTALDALVCNTCFAERTARLLKRLGAIPHTAHALNSIGRGTRDAA